MCFCWWPPMYWNVLMAELWALDWQASRDILREAKTEREGGVREIITSRGMCYPHGLLLIASLMSLWDVLVGCWIWIQLCRLRGVGILAHQTTAQFDMHFFFSYPPSPRHCSLLPLEVSPHQKWPSCDGLASCVCQTALWLFNEAIRQREPPLPLPLLVLK